MPNVLLKTDNLSEQEWLEARRQGIGGSDASSAVGLNPYKSAYELYLEKRGELKPEDLSDNEAVHFGHVLEDIVAQEYSRRTGHQVRRRNAILQHSDHPFMLCNVDRLIVGLENGPGVLECKTAGAFSSSEVWGDPGTDEVPEPYLVQVQHMLSVTGYTWSKLAVLIGGRDFRIYDIQRDDELIADLIDAETYFWECVQDGTPPAVDYSAPSTEPLMKRLYPGTDGSVIELDSDIAEWAEIERDAAEKVKKYQDLRKEAKNRLLDAVGNAAIGLLPDGTGYTRKTVTRKGYTVEPTSYVDFRFNKSAGSKAA